MPLKQGCTRETVSENISKLIDEGYSQERAEAIALDVTYKNKGKCSEERQRELEEMIQ